MPIFFCKPVPPRPTFAQDMTQAEAATMMQHAAYWQGLIGQGVRVFALGLVVDPQGPFGVGIVEVESDAEIGALTADDPAIKANCGLLYEIHRFH